MRSTPRQALLFLHNPWRRGAGRSAQPACWAALCHGATQNTRAAFSLVELSVVVAILAVVATFGLEAASNFVTRTASSVSRERLVVVDDAVVRFFKIYGRLPCPALKTLAPPSGAANNYGLEDCTASTDMNNNTTIGGGLKIGAVPFRTLNLPLSYALDGFNSKFNYVVTKNLTVAGTAVGQFGFAPAVVAYTNCVVGTSTITGISATLSIGSVIYLSLDNAFYSVATIPNGTSFTLDRTPACTATSGNFNIIQPGGIEVRTGVLEQPCATARCQVVASPSGATGAAYLVFSSGADQRGAVSPRGVALNACAYTTASSDARVDTQNCVFGDNTVRTNMLVSGGGTIPYNVFYDNRTNTGLNPRSYFDDAVIWRSKGRL